MGFMQSLTRILTVGFKMSLTRTVVLGFSSPMTRNLLLGFMLLGLVVGIAALGVISARAVVERRHAIGVMRAIGFSRAAVGFSFLAESSFIAILGIGLGLILGIVTGINVISDIKNTQPAIELIIPWGTLALIAVGGYLFALITTLLPARRASTVAPAEALRYE